MLLVEMKIIGSSIFLRNVFLKNRDHQKFSRKDLYGKYSVKYYWNTAMSPSLQTRNFWEIQHVYKCRHDRL